MKPTNNIIRLTLIAFVCLSVFISCKKDTQNTIPGTESNSTWISFSGNNYIYSNITSIKQAPNGLVWIASTKNTGQIFSKIVAINPQFNIAGIIDTSSSPYLLSKITSLGFNANKIYMGAQFYSTPGLSKEILVISGTTYSHFAASGGTAYDFEDFYFNTDGLWYGTGNDGLNNFNNGTFQNYDSGNSAIPYPNYVRKIFPINETDFWFFTSNAMMKKTSAGIEVVRNNFNYDVMDVDSNNDFWLMANYSNTMTKLSGNTVTNIPVPSDFTGNVNVADLAIDSYNNIWIATGGYFATGLYRYKDSIWTRYTPSNSSLQSLKLTTLEVDDLGNLWVGSEDAGVICITKIGTNE